MLPPRRPSQQQQHHHHQQAPSLPPRPTSVQLSVSPSSHQGHQQGTRSDDDNNGAYAPLQPCWPPQQQQAPSLPLRSTPIQLSVPASRQGHAQGTNEESGDKHGNSRVPLVRSQERSAGTAPKLQAAAPTSRAVATLLQPPVSPQTPSLPQRPALPSRTAAASSDADALAKPLPRRPGEKTEANRSVVAAAAAVAASAVRKLPRPPTAIPSQSTPRLSVSEMATPTITNGEPARPRTTGIEPRPPKAPERPTLDDATSGIAATPSSDKANCLHCRDFSAADAHAALFPRANYSDVSEPLTRLADDLTAPFDGSLTDKARVIFSWMHHNISYDAYAFHTHTIEPGQTVESTLASGLAVCGGYAGLYAALATKAGLDCVVVFGHGKGYGFAPHQADQMLSNGEKPSGHAWNAVRIDGGQWKLIDACWGAGIISGNDGPGGSPTYHPGFNPSHFTADHAAFGLKHYPEDRRWLLVDEALGWEEYLRGDAEMIRGGGPVQVFDGDAGGVLAREGIDEASIRPRARNVHLDDYTASDGVGIVTFSFARPCAHWDHTINGTSGAPYVYVLAVPRADGGGDELVSFQYDKGHGVWSAAVRIAMLAPAKGGNQGVRVLMLTRIGGEDGRGYGLERWERVRGKVGWEGSFIARWEVV